MAANPKAVHNSIKPGRWVRSTCKMCLHSCGNVIHVTDDGVINKVEGDPTNPSNKGKLCPKGNAAIMRHYDPNRFKQPLRRTNPEKGPNVDPMWEPISWDEAFDIVGGKLKEALADDPRRIIPSLEDFQKMNVWVWPLAFGNFNFFQSGGTMCGGAYHPVNGYVHSAFAAANDAKHCNFWVNDGTGDGFSSHLHAAAQSYWVANARVDRGMRCVTVEPRLSISGAKSEEWVPIRPATDRQFALSLCHVMVNENWYDHRFLRRDTNAPYLVGPDGYFVRDAAGKIHVWDSAAGQPKLWDDPTIGRLALEGSYVVNGKPCRPAFQRFKDILAECSPEAMEKITTVPPATARRLAKQMYDAAEIARDSKIEIDGRLLPLRPAAYNYYRGAQGHKLGFQTNHAFKMVNFLLGNIDAPGGHMGVTLDDQWVDHSHVEPGENGMIKPTPHQLGPVPPFSYPPQTFHLMDYFPVGVHPPHLNLEVFLNPEKFGLQFRPDTMVICHSNPIWAMQGPREKWFQFMRSMKFIVVCDIVPTETTQWADVILPSHDVFETWNMTMIEPPHTEGMCMRQPAVEPLYDTKSEEDIFNELSERMGILDSYNQVLNMALGFVNRPELMLEPGRKYTDKEIARRKGLLWNGKDLDWYVEHQAVTERRSDKWYRPWEGLRLHFYIEDMLKQRDELQAKMEAAKVPFRREWGWADYQPLPTPKLDPVHEEPPEYDLYGIFYKDIQLNFGENLSNPWVQDIVYRDPVHIALMLNPKTAERQGLKPMDIIRVDSPYGMIYGRLGVSEGWHPDTLGVSNALSRVKGRMGAVKHAGGHFNDLLPYDLCNTDAVTGQPETVCRVKLTRLDDWPQSLRDGGSVYDLVDEIAKPGKGRKH